MGEIVNLRTFRRAKARATATATADANRIAHGRTKAEKQAARIEAERARRLLDGAKLDD